MEPFPTVNLTNKATLDDLITALQPAFDRIRATDMEDMPTDEQWQTWTKALFTDRGGNLRRRKNAPSGASGEIRSLFGQMKWHQSGGDLSGLFIAQMQTDKQTFETIATYVAVMMAAFGHHSSALAAWQRTGLV